MHVKYVKVLDAIVLIIQSLVYQEKPNKPKICALFDPLHRFKFVEINYQQKFTVQYFKKCLFQKVNCILIIIKIIQYSRINSIKLYFSALQK